MERGREDKPRKREGLRSNRSGDRNVTARAPMIADPGQVGTLPFQELPHGLHAQWWAGRLSDPRAIKMTGSCWDLGSADAWLAERSYEIGRHLRAPGDKWVTIGDGRFGFDSIRLMAYGVADAFPTDIDETLLKTAKQRGIVGDYGVENAERLSFSDQSYDYAFCKETLCQCPRPTVALYEMLRIAKKGVILVEPNDRHAAPVRLVRLLKGQLLRWPRIHRHGHSYEATGNHVFTISRREIEKIALALNIPEVAFKFLNDAYEPGLEFEPVNSKRGRRMKRKIALRDTLCRFKLDKPMFIMAAIFRVPIFANQRSAMEKEGWSFVKLPRHRDRS